MSLDEKLRCKLESRKRRKITQIEEPMILVDTTDRAGLTEQVGMEDDEAMTESDHAAPSNPHYPMDDDPIMFFETKYSPEKDLESRKMMFNMKYGKMKPSVEKGTKSAMTGRTTSQEEESIPKENVVQSYFSKDEI